MIPMILLRINMLKNVLKNQYEMNILLC